jgi:hypothetical protein
MTLLHVYEASTLTKKLQIIATEIEYVFFLLYIQC